MMICCKRHIRITMISFVAVALASCAEHKGAANIAQSEVPYLKVFGDYRQGDKVIAGQPKDVIGTAIELVKRDQTVTSEAIDLSLGSGGPPIRNGSPVTLTRLSAYPCATNRDALPPEMLDQLCKGRQLVAKFEIVASQALLQNGKATFPSHSDDESRYRRGQFQKDARNADVEWVDVSNEFGAAWPYHMPRSGGQMQIVAACNCLAIVEYAVGSSEEADPHVIGLEIYQSSLINPSGKTSSLPRVLR